MSAAQPFNPRLVVGLVAAGIVAFAAMLLLLAYGGGLGRGGGRADADSAAATGFRGLVVLMEGLREVHRDETESEWADHLLIVTPDPRDDAGEVRRLLERRGGFPTLVILPKWATRPHETRRGWVRSLGAGLGSATAPGLGDKVEVSLLRGAAPRTVPGRGLLAGIDIPVPSSPQRIEGPGLTPLAPVPGGGALVARIGKRPHYVAADPDLFNNHGLDDPARARAAVAMIERMNAGMDYLDFDLTLGGGGGAAGGRSLLRLAFEPPFLAMTLALVAAALLAGLHGASRFGPTRREPRAIALGKAALVENSAGLIRQAGREARLGGAYANVVRQDVARLTAAPADSGDGDLDRYLNRLGRPDRPGFSELAAQLHAARDRHALMAAARTMFQWKKEAIR